MAPQKCPPAPAKAIEAPPPVASFAARARPVPVEQWDPPHCGDVGLKIARDGTWFHRGAPIRRSGLVRLFANHLRRDEEGHVLVTPVEKTPVEVEDAPFVAVELRRENPAAPILSCRTNVEDWVAADAAHPLRFERQLDGGLKPYVKVRGDLWALLARPLLYELAHWGETQEQDGERLFGVRSCGCFFAMARIEEIEALS